jgi:transporter family-2 protein
MNPYIMIFIAFLVGILLPIQGGINSKLASFLTHPLQAGWVSFAGGLVCLTLLVIGLGRPLPKLAQVTATPSALFIGGLLGVCVVMSAVYLMPRIGAATFLAALITGQLVCSIFMDHFGILGVPVQSISVLRAAGAALLLVGVVMIQRF